ncbi:MULTISPECIES: efflux RND transporter periplasmic adaptor subunit [Delftia]|uniref:efflux RND transporter periplasmic adaptor subunit n=1 Tax=Delftia TaxID=80865 RepID=UPI00285B623E|nr:MULTISPECIES: efflux RND transporter periplasmic adaptor subunit [Delftia]MDR6731384.1 RND family efflux transporter MFP subunit [Delftia lacustris]
MKRRTGWLIGLALLIAIGASAWRAASTRHSKQAAIAAATQPREMPVRVGPQEVVQLQPRQLQLTVPVSGVVQAVRSAVVKAYVAGELRGLQVREGDSVRKGQELARVDATEVEARWRQARQQADAAQAQLQLAQRQHDNNQALVTQGFISTTALATSQSNLDAARANLAAAQAAADVARKSVTDSVLRSPMDGQVAQRLVQDGERVGVETRVLEIVDPSELEVVAQLAPADSVRVQVGQQALLQVQGAGDDVAAVPARVVRINPSAQAGSRSVAVYLHVQAAPVNAGAAGRSIPIVRPGLYLQGSIVTGQTEQLAVPLTAVRTDQPQPYVQLLQPADESEADKSLLRVQHRPVTLGSQSAQDGATWIAVSTGLQAGDRVLAGSVGGLRAGTAVQMQPSQQMQAPQTQAAPAPGAR